MLTLQGCGQQGEFRWVDALPSPGTRSGHHFESRNWHAGHIKSIPFFIFLPHKGHKYVPGDLTIRLKWLQCLFQVPDPDMTVK